MKKNQSIELVVLIGRPGAGKGTLSNAFLAENLQCKAFSTGEALRQQVAMKTDLGMTAKQYMDQGLLVPDYLMAKIVKSSLDELKKQDINKIILDGFPRNCTQVVLMQKLGIIPSKIVEIFVSDKEAIRRLAGRLTCSKCGQSFSMKGHKAPKQSGICDSCGSVLEIRADDSIEKAKKRLKVYQSVTAPVIPELQGIFPYVPYFKIPSLICEDKESENMTQEMFNDILNTPT